MDDDFNTPKALSVLYNLSKKINILKKISLCEASLYGAILKELGKSIGLLQKNPYIFLYGNQNDEKINNLIKERNIARKCNNWQLADQIRNKLKLMSVDLEDHNFGTIWKYNII